MFISITEESLKGMDEDIVNLSKIRKNMRDLPATKYLERPFAYEFYHQFRCRLNNEEFDFKDYVIQGEVLKKYQNYGIDYMPDFIIHVVGNNDSNAMIIEFKLAERGFDEIKKDLDKLLEFKSILGYNTLVEVVLGEEEKIEKLKTKIRNLNGDNEITVFWFKTNSWTVEKEKINYNNID